MQRLLILTAAIAAAVGTSSAGTIQTEIGGANGLTGSYLTSSGANASNDSGYVLKNYDQRLFDSAVGMAAKPYSTYSQNSASTGSLTDAANGVTFAMINDGCGATSGGACNGTTTASNNAWGASGANTLTIPVGIFDATDVYTMLNNQFGQPGANDTTVTFDFGTTATGTTTSLVVNLINGSTGTSIASGQVNSTINCTGVGTSTCNSVATSPLAASSNLTTHGTASSLLPSITVKTDDLLNPAAFSYNSTIPGAGVYGGSTAGTVNLSDQGFMFGSAFSNLYLVDVKVTENVGTGPASFTALSAVTVDSVTTPEPSTLFLFASGLFAIGMTRRRRRS